MVKIVRCILAVVLGVFTFGVVVAVGEIIGHMVFPIPRTLNRSDPESISAAMPNVSTGALIAVLVAWALGAFAGAWVASRLAPMGKLAFGLAIGSIGLVAAVASMLMIPHPTWMWVLSVAEFVPAAYLGAKLAIPGSISRASVSYPRLA